ncbi:unnamed protein product [Rotaria socialis]|uniref:PPPDE domain-containing protein n=2 Tax=Rotaria socialis TaxID=392032 RepID=A0A820S2Q3_9BILA|nr:unnamed protein product [Rotaria socialis]CAF4449004.1 unnamed protein product [Rotaria socialis]
MSNFTTVKLYIYDISYGLASSLGSTLLGKQIDGVWHTGVGVYGREYLFGSSGVSYTAPEEIHRQGLAPKPKSVDLGQTKKTLAEIHTWVLQKGTTNFRGHQYDLLDWNCNNFSDEFTKYLLNSTTSLIPEEILELPRFVKTTPLGRMLLSFLNKDPISAAQQTGNNNNFVDSPMHIIQTETASSTKFDNIPTRHCILPVMDKMKPRVNLIEQKCNRTLTPAEKEQLNDIHQLFRPDATYSPMLTREHLTLLISLMVNSIEDESTQIMMLEILQLLSEYEYVIKILSEIKGQESPMGLLKGLNDQPEQIQVEFLRWFSSIAATSNGRTMLIDLQDDIAPVFTESINNDSSTNKVKYEIIVVLHNLLCINTDMRLSFMNSISIGSAMVQYMSTPVNSNEADTFLAVFIALADAEKDIYGIAKAMEFDPDFYSSIVACQPLIKKIQANYQAV